MPRRSSSVQSSAPRQPFHRLAGDAGDRVEVTVVVEESGTVHVCDGRDQQVNRAGAAMLTTFGKGRLNAGGGVLAALVNAEVSESTKVLGERTVVARSSRRQQELEAHGEAERKVVCLEEGVPPVGGSAAPKPSACVSEIQEA
jgi:hypothetical protein